MWRTSRSQPDADLEALRGELVSWQAGSRYKGRQYKGKWRAAIKINGKTKVLGTFDDEEDAARAFQAAAHRQQRLADREASRKR